MHEMYETPMISSELVGSTDTTRAEDAQGTPNQSHISPSILLYEDKPSKCRVSESSRARRRKRLKEGVSLEHLLLSWYLLSKPTLRLPLASHTFHAFRVSLESSAREGRSDPPAPTIRPIDGSPKIGTITPRYKSVEQMDRHYSFGGLSGSISSLRSVDLVLS